ncbi:hypothetical protein [Cytobacillus purgationiresistens]|uniref:Phosphoglycerol transferase MdoB-like AlkP superfamily enzyme n=1 Tax=Cytobacillus purgationiresistens TaxID=863449 RepID=A0ABU0AN79_9BACI|nr:hypothetical protein [Cytobacillus purgationiresistens]MDQ0272743.1 phosphoglycerol transferase MdoB-like AlkP superfamily enzyme [Cytobacillus purgationiresistens]
MIKFIAVVFGLVGLLLTINLLFSFLYILSKSAGKGLYRWIVYDTEFLMILASPFFGLTELVASHVYKRFNWFNSRLLLVLYAFVLMVLTIIIFLICDHFLGMM